MAAYTAEQRVRLPALKAAWLRQAFVHWPFPPEDVQALLPDGLRVDQFENAAWVSLTPFLMTDLRPPLLPAAAGLPAFPETNLRTYVRRPGGRDGLWFLSNEVGRRGAPMLATRTVGAPYHLGDLAVRAHAAGMTYTGHRWGGGPSYRLVLRPGSRIRPSERDVWLTSRWRAYIRTAGILLEMPVDHEPWPLRAGIIEDLRESLISAVGLPEPREAPLVHFSAGVRHVRLGIPRPAR